jgi:Flp pilus assembly protein CpaB
VSRRARAGAFAFAALACAALAATVAGGYRAGLEDRLGALRPVVVSVAPLAARRPLTPADVADSLEVRRVPARFLPSGALPSPRRAVGLVPTARIPAGSYLVAGLLRPPGRHDRNPRGPELPDDREPVEIQVSGAAALAAASRPAGTRVDVIVTTEPGPGGRGRTYVAAEGVELLALSESGAGRGYPADGDTWTATLALTRPQALRLIEAENFARQVRLIPAPRSG